MKSTMMKLLMLCLLVTTLVVTTPSNLIAQPKVATEETAEKATASKTVFSVTCKSYNDLIKAAGFIGSYGGKPQAGMMAEFLLNMSPVGPCMGSVDKSRPFGVLAQADSAGAIYPIVVLPVADLPGLLKTLGTLGGESQGIPIQDVGNGISEISLPNKIIYAKQAGKWIIASDSEEALEASPADPGALLQKHSKDYLLSVWASVKNIPKPMRQMAVTQIRSGMEDSLYQEEDESDEEFVKRQKMVEIQVQNLTQLIEEINDLSLGLLIPENKKMVALDITYTAQPETNLAERVNQQANLKTNFSGFIDTNAIGTASLTGLIGEEDYPAIHAALAQVKTELKKKFSRDLKNPKKENTGKILSLVDEIIDVIDTTAKAGLLDIAVTGKSDSNNTDFLLGARVDEPQKLEATLKELLEIAVQETDTEKQPKITWNAASHGDVKFHTIDAPISKTDEKVIAVFGKDLQMVIGIGPKSVYYAVGTSPLESLKSAIDASKENASKEISTTFLAQLSAKKFFDFLSKVVPAEITDNQPVFQAALTATAEESYFRIQVKSVENGETTRIELQKGLLDLIGKVAKLQLEAAQNR